MARGLSAATLFPFVRGVTIETVGIFDCGKIQNTLRQTRMLINVGGGNQDGGPVAGIHWHMNLGNEISYIATASHRQVIPWVRVKDGQGKVTEYYDRTRPLSAEQVSTAEKRHMDCIDCHNRPAHIYLPPDVALDQSFAAGRLDPTMPYLKRQAVESLNRPYATEDEAVKAIANSLDAFYRTNYAEVYRQKGDALKGAIGETQRIYKTYFFPEMKTKLGNPSEQYRTPLFFGLFSLS